MLEIYTDASIRENKAAICMIVFKKGKIVYRNAQSIPYQTTVQAETEGLMRGVQYAAEFKENNPGENIIIYTDCIQLVNIINKINTTKDKNVLEKLRRMRFIASSNNLRIKWINGKENKAHNIDIADEM